MRLLAALVLAIHLTWIVWVIIGAVWTRGRPWLTGFHLASLAWGMVAEAGPWPCPLTLLEQHFEVAGNLPSFTGSFLVHYLEAIVYPNVPVWLINDCAIVVCFGNLLLYIVRLVRFVRSTRP